MRYQLENGLTVIFEKQAAAPVVALQVWVKAGSADETPEQAGLAHLHEHMLFKGTARRGLGEIARDVEARGGEVNAWTSFDQTVYHLVLSSHFFAEGLDILSDAVRHSAFDPGELSREIEVVVEEIKRSADLPSRRVMRGMFETAYQRHPYRLPVLGSEASVRSFTREKILEFFRRHYTPDNLVVIVVGDVEESQVRAEVERYFSGTWGARQPPPARAEELAQAGMRVCLEKGDVREAHFSLAWHVPGISDPVIPALDVLAMVLGQGEGSRLSLALKLEKALTNEVYAYTYASRDPGLMVAGASLGPEKLREALRDLMVEIRRVSLHPVDPAELVLAKAAIEADAVYGRETVQGIARKLGFYETTAGGVEAEALYFERVAKVTVEDLHEAARRFLSPENLTFSGLFPEGSGMTEAEIQTLVNEVWREPISPRPAMPPLAAPEVRKPRKKAASGGIEKLVIPGGPTVLVKSERNVPLVALRAVYPGGLRFETEATNGVSQLHSRLMTRSTARRTAAQMAREIDELAGAVFAGAGRNSISLRGEFLSKHLSRGLNLVAECLTEPAFDADELERERSMLLQELAARDDHPSSAAFDLFSRTLYTRHPYRMDVLGEELSVRAMDLTHQRDLHHRALSPSNLTLAIVGDVDPDETLAMCEKLFASRHRLSAEPIVHHEVPQEPELTEPRRQFRELDKAQAHIVYGFLGTTVDAPERYTLDVLSSVLAGQGGRLFVELRDRRSLAYSVSSFSVEGLDPGYFGVYLGTSPDKVAEALAAVRQQLAQLTEVEVSAAELARAKRYLIGAHAISLQRNSARASLLAFDESYGVGAEAYLRYDEEIEAVSSKMVLECARWLLDPSRGALAIVGPKAADLDFAANA